MEDKKFNEMKQVLIGLVGSDDVEELKRMKDCLLTEEVDENNKLIMVRAINILLEVI